MSHNQKQIALFATTVGVLWLMSSFSFFLSLGVIASILFHELGHAYFIHKTGGTIKGIYLIPFVGGVLVHGGEQNSRYNEGKILLGGPLFGIVSGFMTYAFYYFTGCTECLKLAEIIGIINLFNLLPISNLLDGGQLVSTFLSCFMRNGYRYGQYITFFLLILAVVFFLNSNIILCMMLIFFSYLALKNQKKFNPERINAKIVGLQLAVMYVMLFAIGFWLVILTK